MRINIQHHDNDYYHGVIFFIKGRLVMKYKLIIIVSFLLFIIGCSNINSNLYTKKDILNLSNKEIKVNNNVHKLLDNSSEISESSEPYTLASGFIPDEIWKENLKLNGGKEQFMYLKSKTNDNITGTVVYDNATDKVINITTIFLQGNKNAMIKLKGSTDWKPAIYLSVPADSTVEFEIEINWNSNGSEELTFFPLNHSNEENRYNGGNLGVFRFFVMNKKEVLTKEMLKNQSFNLPSNFNMEKETVFPSPSWMGSTSFNPNYISQNNKRYTKEKIKGIRLDPIPYNTTVDIIWIDEFGNTNLLADNIEIKKRQSTEINIEKEILEDIYKTNNRQFLLVLNNRGQNILADIKAVDQNNKPFPTTYQGIIEIYPVAE